MRWGRQGRWPVVALMRGAAPSCSAHAARGRKERGKEKEKEKRKEERKRKEKGEKEKEKEGGKKRGAPAGFAAAVASACRGFGGKRRARNEENREMRR